MHTRGEQDRFGRVARKFAGLVIVYRRFVLAAAALVLVICGLRTARTYAALTSDLADLLPKSAPSVHALAALHARLPGVRYLGVVIDTGGEKNLPAADRFVADLAARIQGYPPDLVAGVQDGSSNERRFVETWALSLIDPEDVRALREAVEQRRDREVMRASGLDLLEDEPLPVIPIQELRQKYQRRLGDRAAHRDERFVSEDGSTRVLLVRSASHVASYEADAALLERVQRDIAALGFPGAYASEMQAGFAGDVATYVEETRGLATDLGISGAVVLLLVVLLLLLFFRSWRVLIVLGVPLATGTLAAFGVVALPPLSITYLNSNTAFLASIIVGNGINSGIILLARFQEERGAGRALEPAIVNAFSTSLRPTLASAAAAAAAYGSLIFTDFRGFNQFGWIGGVGMLCCWAATFLIAPALLWVLPVDSKASGRARIGGGLVRGVFARPRAVLIVAGVALFVSALGIARRSGDWLENDLSKLRRRDSGERYWGARMNATLGRYLTPSVVLAESAEQAREIEARLKALKERGGAGGLISAVHSSSSVLPPRRAEARVEAQKLAAALSPRLRAGLSERDRAFVERALGAAADRGLQLEDVPPSLLAGLREYDGRVDRSVLVMPTLGSGTWDARRIAEFTRDVRQAATLNGAAAPVAGALLLSSDLTTAMAVDGPRATALALGAVLLVCLLAFGSIGLTFSSVASLAAGVLLMLGALGWTGARLNFTNFIALPITFGIAAEYSINVIKRWQTNGSNGLDRGLGATVSAVAVCSLTTMVGYGSLLMAQNRALFSFGEFAVTGELTCLFTAIVLLPAALALQELQRRFHENDGVLEGGETAKPQRTPR